MKIPDRLVRQLSLVIPILFALLFFGILESILGLQMTDNIASTGLTIRHLAGALSILLFYWIYKRRIG